MAFVRITIVSRIGTSAHRRSYNAQLSSGRSCYSRGRAPPAVKPALRYFAPAKACDEIVTEMAPRASAVHSGQQFLISCPMYSAIYTDVLLLCCPDQLTGTEAQPSRVSQSVDAIVAWFMMLYDFLSPHIYILVGYSRDETAARYLRLTA